MPAVDNVGSLTSYNPICIQGLLLALLTVADGLCMKYRQN
jgi:hypothetical protein